MYVQYSWFDFTKTGQVFATQYCLPIVRNFYTYKYSEYSKIMFYSSLKSSKKKIMLLYYLACFHHVHKYQNRIKLSGLDNNIIYT
jgi:hypothetical protein